MLDIKEISRLLKDRRLDIVSDATNLSPATIRRIRDGEVTDPASSTHQRLSDYLQATAPARNGNA